MIYNNLIYLIVIIFILSTNSVPEIPQFGPLPVFLLFSLKGSAYFLVTRILFHRKRITQAADYFSAEQKLSIMAITWLAVDVYFLDCQYYFAMIPGSSLLPILVSVCGILLFFFYLSILWMGARSHYGRIFGRDYSASSFVKINLKNNIPIILPWLLLSLLADLLMLLPFPGVKLFFHSAWGEPLFFLVFFILLAVVLPGIITRLWGCRSMEAGPVRSHVEAFCQKLQLKYADILIWPLFEGQVLTAGVMGMSKRFRYLLFTPALLDSMTVEEVDGVMAHEIGHVKRYHLQLYMVLLLGFSLIAQLGTYIFMYLLLKSDYFYQLTAFLGKKTDAVLIFFSSFGLLVLLILYFRYVFGFFMRNFERQADLYAMESLGSSSGIINALEKVAWLSGDIRDLPSWHHFGIGERVEFLQRCEKEPTHIRRHHRKVYGALVAYLAVLVLTGFTLWKMPSDLLERAPLDHLAKLYHEKTVEEPQNPLWLQLLGDLQQGRHHYGDAINAYKKALDLVPQHPEILNNLAWIFLTATDLKFRDPQTALMLARIAAEQRPAGYILDTLAMAYWQNGFPQKAQQVEREAIRVDPEHRHYYEKQMERFGGAAEEPK
ncbi:MAG: M48 family metalloprotease [Pseudomonadota bacterium]